MRVGRDKPAGNPTRFRYVQVNLHDQQREGNGPYGPKQGKSKLNPSKNKNQSSSSAKSKPIQNPVVTCREWIYCPGGRTENRDPIIA